MTAVEATTISPRLRAGAWLRPEDLRFAFLWVVIPNAPFVAFWPFACPIRTAPMLVYVLIGFLTARAPFVVTAATVAAAIVFDALWFIGVAYGLSITMLAESLPFAWNMHFYKSPIFLGAGLALFAVFAAILILDLRWRAALRTARPYPALLLMAGLAAIDLGINLPPTMAVFGVGNAAVPFQSAASMSGFRDRLLSGEAKRAVLVVVEGWGELTDAELRARVEASFVGADLAKRYDVSFGTSTYVGSTTAGEARELCDMRSTHDAFLELGTGADCLPKLLQADGYRTIGVHGFTKEFFRRDEWWPHIGFAEWFFAEELVEDSRGAFKSTCGPIFTGLCDDDVADWVGNVLAENGEKPLFLYWLTLNTHLPVVPEANGSRFACASEADAFADAQTCAMADIWRKTFAKIAALAADPRLSETEFLIVGDHSPPSWTRRGRSLFTPGVVRWASLVPRGRRSGASLADQRP